MRTSCGAIRPAVDPTFLCRIREEREHGESLRQLFVADFIEGWPARFDYLRVALTTADLKGAREATGMLKMTSEMVGAERLMDLVMDLEDELRSDFSNAAVWLPQVAATHLQHINQCGCQAIYLLHSQALDSSCRLKPEGKMAESTRVQL